jgi:hypothetical protein
LPAAVIGFSYRGNAGDSVNAALPDCRQFAANTKWLTGSVEQKNLLWVAAIHADAHEPFLYHAVELVSD